MMRHILGLCLLTAALRACSNPKSATKVNFAKAIDAKLSKNPICLPVPTNDLNMAAGAASEDEPFPLYIDPSKTYIDVVKRRSGKSFADERNDQLNALVAIGFLSVKTEPAVVNDGWGKPATKPLRTYRLTETGRGAITIIAKTYGKDAEACYATPAVAEIVRYTEPSSAFGATITQVQYRQRLTKRAAWSENPVVVEAFQIGEPGKAVFKESLILNNDGWAAQGS